MRELLLRCNLPIGDIVLLTAAVRDLHLSYPGQFRTALETGCPEIWEFNSHIMRPEELSDHSEIVDCRYSLIEHSNLQPYHAIHAFIHFLNERLKVTIRPTYFKGDIHLSNEERIWCSQVCELVGEEIPFWIVVTGGKNDATVKWWPVERYQEVVDHFAGKIQFVQVGAAEHYHPPLKRVIDFRGKTDLRQLIRLVHHSQGILCPVTSLMHLAAAVDIKGDMLKNRPCVVIAGGREPSQWEAYPHHQFIHTNGSLLCCDNGGCWKSRTRPLGDGSEFDHVESLCVDPVGDHPRCLDIIKPAHVIRRIEMYFQGEIVNYLTPPQARLAQTAVAKGERLGWKSRELEWEIYRARSEKYIASIPNYPNRFYGRGIIICAGGVNYFTNAWVGIHMLRRLGCALPIQVWFLGKGELDERMETLLKPLGVECIDATRVSRGNPMRQLNGWSLKPFAMLHSSFKEILLLDADNVSIQNPERLFESPEFKETGAIFWPDLGRLGPERSIWQICGVPYQNEPEFESGQMLIDKERAWKPLSLAMWYNENSDFYYQHIHGDKDTCHMAFRRLQQSYAMPARAVAMLDGAMCQHDFEGQRLFQHRNSDRWNLTIAPKRIKGFRFHNACLGYLQSLRKIWNGKIEGTDTGDNGKKRTLTNEITSRRYDLYVSEAKRKHVVFSLDGRIDSNDPEGRWSWKLRSENGEESLQILSRGRIMSNLHRTKSGKWQSSDGGRATLIPSRNKPHLGRIKMRAAINAYTGYGLHSIQIASDFIRSGYDMQITPIGFDERFAEVPLNIRECLMPEAHHENRQFQRGEWELLLNPPNLPPTLGKRTVFFTMWESSRLPANGVDYLNQAECIVVPCKWNLECFRAQGVNRPIHQIPLGINTKIFKYSPLKLTGPCVFGTAGRTAVGGVRKGLDHVIQAFQQAFPSERDVRLYVKAFPDCEISKIDDPRIIIIQEYLTEKEMAKWYRSITCFVSAARGEGWGLMQHQALATGRPLISIEYGGVKEFFNKNVGYPVDFRLAPAGGHYERCGDWAEPQAESLIERMRQVYQNRGEAAILGEQGARETGKLSWQRSNQELLQILRKIGMLM